MRREGFPGLRGAVSERALSALGGAAKAATALERLRASWPDLPPSPPWPAAAQVHAVGGAVRDALLADEQGVPEIPGGVPADPGHTDRDWVVTGATPEDMVAAGFIPVGRDFPVFLHPQTHEEYALARTERKSGRGYHGFTFHASPEVTLAEDLARRDLTINAMAQTREGAIVDPFGGHADLAAGILRHISPAFAEDPVRLLRIARFAARWPRFAVAPETMQLLRQLVADGEVDALVPERVLQELTRGLMEPRPSRMLEVLAESGALPRLLPGVANTAHRREALDRAVSADDSPHGASQTVRLALLLHEAPALAARPAIPAAVRSLVDLVAREGKALEAAVAEADCTAALTPDAAAAIVALLDRCDAWRRPDRLAEACSLLRVEHADRDPQRFDRLEHWRRAATAVDTAAVAATATRAGARGPEIGATITQARIAAVQAASAR